MSCGIVGARFSQDNNAPRNFSKKSTILCLRSTERIAVAITHGKVKVSFNIGDPQQTDPRTGPDKSELETPQVQMGADSQGYLPCCLTVLMGK